MPHAFACAQHSPRLRCAGGALLRQPHHRARRTPLHYADITTYLCAHSRIRDTLTYLAMRCVLKTSYTAALVPACRHTEPLQTFCCEHGARIFTTRRAARWRRQISTHALRTTSTPGASAIALRVSQFRAPPDCANKPCGDYKTPACTLLELSPPRAAHHVSSFRCDLPRALFERCLHGRIFAAS